jgi:hypothetical protein
MLKGLFIKIYLSKMEIVPLSELRNVEIQEDMNIINDNDPFIRAKATTMTAEIIDETKRLQRKLTLRERREIERKYENNNNQPTKKMTSRGRPKKVEPEKIEIRPGPQIIERAEELKQYATPAQEKKIQQMKEVNQEEMDDKEFEKFLKMMEKFDVMIVKMEEKKRKEEEEALEKERKLEEKYYKKFMERQALKARSQPQRPQKQVYLDVPEPEVEEEEEEDVSNPNGYTEEEMSYSKYF